MKNFILSLAKRFEGLAKYASEDANYQLFLTLINKDASQVSLDDFQSWLASNDLSGSTFQITNRHGIKALFLKKGESFFLLSTSPFSRDDLESLSSGEYEGFNPFLEAIRPFIGKNESFISDESFIPRQKNIPGIHVARGTISEEKRSTLEEHPLIGLSKDLSQYPWLYESLNYVSGGCTVEQANEFFQENKDKIFSIIRSFFTTQNPTYLGAASDGYVYQISDNHILKIFKSTNSYQKAKQSLQRLHSETRLGRSEAAIYDVGVLGTGNFDQDIYKDVPIYYYVMEKMEPFDKIHKTNKELFESVNSLRSQILEMINSNPDLQEMKESIDQSNPDKFLYKTSTRRAIKDIVEEIDQYLFFSAGEDIETADSFLTKKDWLPLFIEEIIIKYLTDRLDLFMNNLGISGHGKHKSLKFFDPVMVESDDEQDW